MRKMARSANSRCHSRIVSLAGSLRVTALESQYCESFADRRLIESIAAQPTAGVHFWTPNNSATLAEHSNGQTAGLQRYQFDGGTSGGFERCISKSWIQYDLCGGRPEYLSLAQIRALLFD